MVKNVMSTLLSFIFSFFKQIFGFSACKRLYTIADATIVLTRPQKGYLRINMGYYSLALHLSLLDL